MFDSRTARLSDSELQRCEGWLLGEVSPFKVEVITTSQNCPPDATDVLLGTVNSKLMEAFQCQVLLLWN